MKKIWKVLGIAAIAASIPFVIRTDPETRERTYDALLWQVRTLPNPETGKTEVTSVSILPIRQARRYDEADLFADEELVSCPCVEDETSPYAP